MGLISSLFTESQFDDYRELQNILEAEEDDNFDMPDDTEEQDQQQEAPADDIGIDAGGGDDNFDMPDDAGTNQGEGQEAQPQAQQDTPQEAPAADAPMDDVGGDDNFDMPDDTGTNQTNTTQDQGQDTGGEAPTGDTGGGDLGDTGDTGGEDNFDLPDDAGEGDGDTGEDGTDTTADAGPDPDQDLKDAEADIFDNLSDQDKVTKINELKSLYEDLYNRIVTLYDKVNDLPKDDDLIKVYNFVIDNLSDLKQFVYDYTSSTFDNKTYLENLINYKKYLSTLNIINGILEEVRQGLYSADK